MRFSLFALFVAVTAVAAGCSFLQAPFEIAAKFFVTGCLFTLLGSILGIVHTRAQKRAFWIGFVVFGWGYFLAWWGALGGVPDQLVTSLTLGYLSNKQVGTTSSQTGYMLIGHSGCNLLIAWLGGMLSCYLSSVNNPHSTAAPTDLANDDVAQDHHVVSVLPHGWDEHSSRAS